MPNLILTINPGSTSTKLALFRDQELIAQSTNRYSSEQLSSYATLIEQLPFRYQEVIQFLHRNHIEASQLSAIVGRGGLLKPLPNAGTYLVNQRMLNDLRQQRYGIHAANLGALLAFQLATPHEIPCFVVNPVVVDELRDEARVSGHPLLPRKSIYHALNQKAIALKYCEDCGLSYLNATLIIAHLGGGISIGLHHLGRTIDVNNALGGEGPMSPERSGTLSAIDLLNLIHEGTYSYEELTKMIIGKGGMMAHLGTTNMQLSLELVNRGDTKATAILKAMCYQIAKEIGALFAVAPSMVNAIILTGGLAYNDWIVQTIKSYLHLPTPLAVYPGEDEMLALAEGALRVLLKKERALVYEG